MPKDKYCQFDFDVSFLCLIFISFVRRNFSIPAMLALKCTFKMSSLDTPWVDDIEMYIFVVE